MALRTPPSWLQNGSHPAENDRLTTTGIIWRSAGVADYAALKVSQSGTPGMSVSIAAGHGLIAGTQTANQGFYISYNDAATTVAIATASVSLPRIDRIVVVVQDSYYGGTANNQVIFQSVTGTSNVSPVAPAAPANPAVPAPQASSLVRQDMPVASGNVPQMNTQQTARFEEGQTLQKESTSLAQAAQEAKQTTRKIKENISAASGSAPGQALRTGGKWLAGNEQLDELVKNLADSQIRQSALMGNTAATDAARETYAKANGNENITAQALAQIVQRADASSTALEKFNSGLNKYYEKAGTYNGPIHARNFKQTWAENYDPRIFMVQNINSSDMSGAEKQIQLQAVLKGTTEEERKSLAKKAETIKRIERGDF